jgi:hypothetical protein
VDVASFVIVHVRLTPDQIRLPVFRSELWFPIWSLSREERGRTR